MNKSVGYVLGAAAFAFIPLVLYLTLSRDVTFREPQAAFQATLAVLALDAALFLAAAAPWALTRWERAGLAIMLPLLLAMASWMAMMGMVATKMGAAG